MDDKKAQFQFFGSLNDFLSASKKNGWIAYTYHEKPAIKDAIEAIGVPHPEVDVILVNGTPAQLLDPLQPDAEIEVYPLHHTTTWPSGYSLRTAIPTPPAFVLDVHLGRLVKLLRMLGLDTLYENDYTDAAIAQIAQEQERIILTRDIGLLKHRSVRWGYWLRSQQADEQLLEVIRYFDLKPYFKPFCRCLACNGLLREVPKETVLKKLPPKTRLHFEEFFQCQTCQRVYWKGSHYERMVAFVNKIEE
ncbi:Mut7-C RNAse domain-containing protein [Telluribacter humicola]|uniref:Mut7-C RNAse domain-containing protein n=1 Tax=Telluribacter humicola TaxID=1720261 RepID=UPI001A961381|nr:Mut7-C RNAse domain-containing protein [Telluribacter humicola]